MILTLSNLLEPEDVASVRANLERAQPSDAAGLHARVHEAVLGDPLFLLGVQPRRMSAPAFARYDAGMSMPPRGAAALPEGPQGLRADAGVVLFLSAADTYDGGALLLDTGWGAESIPGGAGNCVVHPASARRGVAPVTRGTLWVACWWVQSLVPDPRHREILYDLGWSARWLEVFGQGETAEALSLWQCHENLLRLWAGP